MTNDNNNVDMPKIPKTASKTIDIPSTDNSKQVNKSLEEMNQTVQNNSASVDSYKKHIGYYRRVVRHFVFLVLSILLIVISSSCYKKYIKEVATYNENATVSYEVCLKENNYYSEKCLGENAEYLSAITDKIKAEFKYTLIYQENETKDIKYYIKSRIKMTTEDDKEYLNKEDALSKEGEMSLNGLTLSVVENIEIPYNTYNTYINNYKKEYGVDGNSVLTVSLIIVEGKGEKEVSSIDIPLNKNSYNISKNEIVNANKEYAIKSNYRLKNLLIFGVLLGIALTIVAIVKITNFFIKTRNRKATYQKKLEQTLNTFSKDIVILKDSNIDPNKSVYKVESFSELLDVKHTINKPIICCKVNSVKTDFYVEDTDKIYKYVMKEADFEDKK